MNRCVQEFLCYRPYGGDCVHFMTATDGPHERCEFAVCVAGRFRCASPDAQAKAQKRTMTLMKAGKGKG